MLLTLIFVGVLSDIVSCYLSLRRNRSANGPSGVAQVTVIVCYLLPLLVTERSVITYSYWLDCLVLVGFHVFLVYLVPAVDRRCIRAK